MQSLKNSPSASPNYFLYIALLLVLYSSIFSQLPYYFSIIIHIYLSSSSYGCAASEDVFSKLTSLQLFIRDLHWPDEDMAEHLNRRLKLMASDMIEAVAKRY